MSDLLDMILSGVGVVGNVLDTPGALVRNTLSGRNPFAGLNPFDAEGRASGRDMLESWGALDQNQEGLDLGDVVGFGAEMLLDPLNFLGTKAITGTMKAGREAAEANAKLMSHADEANRLLDATHVPASVADAYNADVIPQNARSLSQRESRWFPEENLQKTALNARDPGAAYLADPERFWSELDRFNAEHVEGVPLGYGQRDVFDSSPHGELYKLLAGGKVDPQEFSSRAMELWGSTGKPYTNDFLGPSFSFPPGEQGLIRVGDMTRMGEISRDEYQDLLSTLTNFKPPAPQLFRKDEKDIISLLMDAKNLHGKGEDDLFSALASNPNFYTEGTDLINPDMLELGGHVLKTEDPRSLLQSLGPALEQIEIPQSFPKLYHGSPYAGRFDPWSIDVTKSSHENLYTGNRGHFATANPEIAAGGSHHSYAMGATSRNIPLSDSAKAEIDSLRARLKEVEAKAREIDSLHFSERTSEMSALLESLDDEADEIAERIQSIRTDPTYKDWAPGAHMMYADYRNPWNMDETKPASEWLKGSPLAGSDLSSESEWSGDELFSNLSRMAKGFLKGDPKINPEQAETFRSLLERAKSSPIGPATTGDELATDLIKSLGYDSIFHTGGTMMGRGMGPGALHQVAINILDNPGSAYYKPWIAPMLEPELVPHPGYITPALQDVPSANPLLAALLGYNATTGVARAQ